jgi:hypothetical protein
MSKKSTATAAAVTAIAAPRVLTYETLNLRVPTVLPDAAREPLMDMGRDYVMSLSQMPLPDWDRQNLSEGHVRSLAFATDFRLTRIGDLESQLRAITTGADTNAEHGAMDRGEYRDADRAPIAGLASRAQTLGHRLQEAQMTAQAVFLMFHGAYEAHIEAFGKEPDLGRKSGGPIDGKQVANAWTSWGKGGR